MTTLFIYIIFGIIVVFDIYLVIAKKAKITDIFRKWYKEFPWMPYAVGVVFIGHFGLFIDFSWIPHKISLGIFIAFSIVVLAWSIICRIRYYKKDAPWDTDKRSSKLYKLCCKIFLIPMAVAIIFSFS